MKKLAYLTCLLALIITGCNKKETLNLISINNLYPLQAGRIFIYRLDSTVSVNFGAALVKVSYLAKDSVDAQFTDASGRKAFRIYRYLTDTLATQPWQYIATYEAVFDNNHIEYVDNNLRFIPLASPVTENTTWLGNSYINTSLIQYNYLDGWNYQYQDIGQPYTVNKGVIPNTVTVLQQDQSFPTDTFNPSTYNAKDYSVEVYAVGVGLIYKNFLHYVYQVTPTVGYEDGSYGITLNLVDYR